VLFTADPSDPAHPARLEAALKEFSPDDGTGCRLDMRGSVSGNLYLLAAWNMEELVSPALAARILGLERSDVDAMLAAGAFPGAVKGPEPRSRYERATWLIPRLDILSHGLPDEQSSGPD
jgi:hypothetical protein